MQGRKIAWAENAELLVLSRDDLAAALSRLLIVDDGVAILSDTAIARTVAREMAHRQGKSGALSDDERDRLATAISKELLMVLTRQHK